MGPEKRTAMALAMIASLAPAIYCQSLTIYCEENAPMQTVGKEGKLGGFAVEVVQELQKRVGDGGAIQIVPWARGYEEIKKRADVALFSMGRTAEREGMFQWVGPLFETNYAFYSNPHSGVAVKSLDEAKKAKAIGVVLNDVRDQFLTKAGFTNLKRSSDYATIYRMLNAGRLDLAVGSLVNIEAQLEQAGVKRDEVRQECVFLKAQLFIAFSTRTSPQTVEKWSRALDAMKAEGNFERIYRKFFPAIPLPGPAITF